jgi:hypothetical protein
MTNKVDYGQKLAYHFLNLGLLPLRWRLPSCNENKLPGLLFYRTVHVVKIFRNMY